MVAISFGPSVGGRYFVEASGSWRLLGTLELCMPRELQMTPRKMAPDLQIPRQNLAHLCCAEFCHPIFCLFLTFSLPGNTSGACALPGENRPLSTGDCPLFRNLPWPGGQGWIWGGGSVPPPSPPCPRTETCGVLVTDGKHTSAQQKPCQWYHRRLSALQ